MRAWNCFLGVSIVCESLEIVGIIFIFIAII